MRKDAFSLFISVQMVYFVGESRPQTLKLATSSPGSKQELEGGVFPTPCKAKTGEAVVFGHPVCQTEAGLVKPSP